MFNIGDEVKLKDIQPDGLEHPPQLINARLIIEGIGERDHMVRIKNMGGLWFDQRFELVEAGMPEKNNHFRVGDKIRLINAGRAGNHLLMDRGGEIFTVTQESRGATCEINVGRGPEDNAVFTRAFELVEEAVPVRRDIKKDLRVGDRVVALKHFIRRDDGILMKLGDVAVVTHVSPNGFSFSIENYPLDGCSRDCWELEENYLADNAPVEQKEGPMTRFVFCSRGGKYYGKGDYNSLEAALVRAKEISIENWNADVHPFVIVEG